jgi:feruloyl esterase
MHGSVAAAKEITKAFYDEDIQYSYYSACSNGGRQGLKEMQLYPATFDGAVIGAPAWQLPALDGYMVNQAITNSADNAETHIPTPLFAAIVAEMMRQCDHQDGVTDNIISDPHACQFDFNTLLCRPDSNTSGCLTAAQLQTAEKLYAAYWETGQSFVHAGFDLGTDASILAQSPNGIATSPFRYWLHNDTDWDISQYSYQDVLDLAALDPGQATADDFDLSPFQARGGKMLMYHGQIDLLIPSGSSVHLYNQILRTLEPKGIDMDSFSRFYLVPGMNHCAKSPVAPAHFGATYQDIIGATHSVPGFEDAKHDMVLALMEWVEKGSAPEEIVATKFRDDTVGQVERQRPLCKYPLQAKFVGGDVDAAQSWECMAILE